MKPLLRAVLIIDALLLLAFGLLFLLTPWTSLYNALQLVQTQPALVGQGLGIALIGLAWLAFHASIDGALTSTVAKVIGHVNWLTGLLMLVWLIGMHRPELTGFGQLVAVLTAVVLVVVGLGGVRLSGAVRRRERERLAELAAAERAERQAAKDAARGRDAVAYRAEPVVAPVAAPPVHPVSPLSPAIDPVTGRPVDPDLAAANRRGLHPLSDAEARSAAEDAAGTPRPPFHG
jgi:signal transduction histidine kinase